ncbi:MAG TPA: hypothetical protein VLT62_06525 [Candidatus Methylomirabilis sp.]|nr:hypothetical protein [Candidatus Methylomirabilis sp.]
MSDSDAVIQKIFAAFEKTQYPGDPFLLGSREGCEPFEEVEPFRGKTDWRGIQVDFLEAHAGALSFFSEGAFRFFMPAYLVADLRGHLQVADPLFHLTHGFSDFSVKIPTRTRVFVIRSGKSKLVNPRRYGAMTTFDYARFRLSVFTREEAGAIVAYLASVRDRDRDGLNRPAIDAALSAFWLERAQAAPVAEHLRQHLSDEEEYLAAIRQDKTG